MNSTNYTDEEIVQKLQSDALSVSEKNFFFELLVNKYKNKIMSLIYNIGRPGVTLQDVEEIAIETFLKFYQNIKNLKSAASAETYIYRIAINLTKNFLKSKRLTGLNTTPIEELQELPENYNLEQEVAKNQYEQEIKNIMLNILNSLPEKQKVALKLVLYEKMSYKQIAEVMDTTVSSVESLLFRAKQNIKKYILRNKELAKKLNINLE